MRVSLRYRIGIHVAALVVAVVILAPFAWMLIASISPQVDLIARPYHWLPSHVTLSRYSQLLHGRGDDAAAAFRESFLNSTIVAVGTVVISMAVGILGAYAFAMLRFRFRRATLMVFLATLAFPWVEETDNPVYKLFLN